MADTAAFFANKKKKKKAFKFNANKIDASSVTQSVHVDAPALSTDTDGTVGGGTSTPSLMNTTDATTPELKDAGEQWDDEALAAKLTRKGTAPLAAASVTTELLDMKALDLKRNEQGDIAEKLRVEETKAQLAAAREGMEREAHRIKEEREKKEQAKQQTEGAGGKPRFGAAAAGMAGAGGAGGAKWLPPHLRGGAGGALGGGASLMARERMGGAAQKLDTQDENLFPDLAAAEAIMENKKQQQPAFKAPKKTPVGGGATWASRPKKVNPEPRKVAPEPAQQQPEPTPTPEPEPAPQAEKSAEPTSSNQVESTTPSGQEESAAAAAPIKPKKKKKKDLSTFKG